VTPACPPLWWSWPATDRDFRTSETTPGLDCWEDRSPLLRSMSSFRQIRCEGGWLREPLPKNSVLGCICRRWPVVAEVIRFMTSLPGISGWDSMVDSPPGQPIYAGRLPSSLDKLGGASQAPPTPTTSAAGERIDCLVNISGGISKASWVHHPGATLGRALRGELTRASARGIGDDDSQATSTRPLRNGAMC